MTELIRRENLTVREASQYLRTSEKNLYRLVSNQAIPFIKKKGIGIRFRIADLDRWLQEGYVMPKKGNRKKGVT
jgi:excisionase family DNA binding protein